MCCHHQQPDQLLITLRTTNPSVYAHYNEATYGEGIDFQLKFP